MNRLKRYVVLGVWLSVSTLGVAAEDGLEYFRNLQKARREIYSRVAPSVVRVELVHRSIPAYILNSLDLCVSECEFEPWQHGKVSNEEASFCQQHCHSFMDYCHTKFRETLRSETRTVVWHDFLNEAFDEWHRQALSETAGKERSSLEELASEIEKRLSTLSENLKNRSVLPKPMVRDQSTGLIIRKGFVVTTFNIARGIDSEDWIRVWSDKQVAYSTGEVVGTDPNTNLAVIRLSSPAANLAPIPIGNPDIEPEVGDFAFFFYYPFNQGLSMRTGEITSLYNRLPFFNCTGFHSTSFPTSPGTLGGPIVDLDGNLIGINALYMGQGNLSEITYALPVGNVLACVDQILDKGRVERGQLGVYLSEFECPVGHHTRVSVLKVVPGSPADSFGIRQGDIINSINGKKVSCRMEAVSQLYRTPPEKPVRLEIDRNGEVKTIQLNLSLP